MKMWLKKLFQLILAVFTLTSRATAAVVAEYNFNGTLSESTGNLSAASNHGTYFTADRFGNVNGALGFSGSQYATISGLGSFLSGKSSASVSGWYLFNSGRFTSGFMVTAPGQEGITPSLGIEVSAWGYLGGYMGVWYDVYTTAQPQQSAWHQITSVINQGSQPTLYLDGVEQPWMSPWVPSSLSNPIPSFTSDYGLGARIENGNPVYFSRGGIDDLQFYDSALSSLQVSQIYTQQLIPEPSALSLLAVGLGGLALVRRRRS
jgi:hypothetical protein